MLTLHDKAGTLLQVAKSIEDENFHDDVTLDEQLLLEEVVRAVRAAGNLLMLHVKVIERDQASIELIDAPRKRKLRVVK
jgi:hypothetical protein